MEWSGAATVLSARKHGEHAVILTAFAREVGIISGALPGGASAKRAAMIQPGSILSLRWRARIEGQLGTFAAEPQRMRPGLLADGDALAGVNAVTALLAFALPERDPHPRLHDSSEALLDRMDQGSRADWAHAYLGWELQLLDEMGFGLDLTRCAVTGSREGLAYVSPKTGRAVSRAGAGDWAAKLLPLPSLLGGTGNGGMVDAFAITGHFLRAQLAEAHAARNLPPARDRLIARLLRAEL
ncbi:DNA repair protein RecO [Paracoccus aminophilus JCM 7686]|uniref:DNA repair protein RecO n=2 Tax=Paracoccus aminophilus TaxID=34003 RepID=S5XRN6_PARAH|nr:DNA repair protein RecO [Paracoccus aminophilus]AGT07767.1 DNA repair protein RecO [Paracoccus aminophilus JCM 7686]